MALFQDFAGSLSQLMEPAMNKFAQNLLEQVARDYNLDLQEMSGKYLNKEAKWAPQAVKIDLNVDEGAVEKPQKAQRPPKRKKIVETHDKLMCTGLTAKGTACKNKAKEGECLCHIHLRKAQKGDEAPKPRKKKTQKVEPQHNHPIAVEPEEPCDVCEQLGDVSHDTEEPQFEVDDDVQARLRAILEEVDVEEEEEE